jgi:hypothetical protein
MQATANGRTASYHPAVALPVSIHRHEGWVALEEVMVWRQGTPVVVRLEWGKANGLPISQGGGQKAADRLPASGIANS